MLSSAVTVKLNDCTSVTADGAVIKKWVAGPAAVDTTISALVPVVAVVDVSVAVIVWLPGVFKVALKVSVPFVKVESIGRLAAASVLVKWSVSAKFVIVVVSSAAIAVAVNENDVPAVAVDGVERSKWMGLKAPIDTVLPQVYWLKSVVGAPVAVPA